MTPRRIQDQIHQFRRLPLRRAWTMMPKMAKRCILLVIMGHLLTYVPYVIQMILPLWMRGNVDWFISGSFHMKMARYWYFKDTADNALLGITYYVLAKVASRFSDVLFVIFFIFLGYHAVDFLLFWWDFNSQFYLYVDLFWTILVFISLIISPYTPEKFARIRSLF
jgi:hypothetical protein